MLYSLQTFERTQRHVKKVLTQFVCVQIITFKAQSIKQLLINSYATIIDNRYIKNAQKFPNLSFEKNVGTKCSNIYVYRCLCYYLISTDLFYLEIKWLREAFSRTCCLLTIKRNILSTSKIKKFTNGHTHFFILYSSIIENNAPRFMQNLFVLKKPQKGENANNFCKIIMHLLFE